MKHWLFSAPTLVAALALTACSTQDVQQPAAAPPAAPAAPAVPPPPPPPKAAIGEFGLDLTAAKPDILVMVGADHFHQFFHDNYPTFLIGKQPKYDATFYNPFTHLPRRC